MIDTNKEKEWLQDWVNDPADEGTTNLDKRQFTADEVEMIMFIYKEEQVKKLNIDEVSNCCLCNGTGYMSVDNMVVECHSC